MPLTPQKVRVCFFRVFDSAAFRRKNLTRALIFCNFLTQARPFLGVFTIFGKLIINIPCIMIRLFFISLAIFVFHALSAQETGQANENPVNQQNALKDSNQQDSVSKKPSQKFKGYLAFSWSQTIPVGDYKTVSEYGTQINFMDAAFFLTENVGLTAAWIGGGTFMQPLYRDNWTYLSALGGLVFSVPFSETFAIDARAMAGHSRTHYPDYEIRDHKAESTAYMISYIMRYKITDYAHIQLSAEYYHTDTEFNRIQINQEIRTYSFGAGIAYRIPRLF